ncbi:MAG TPA: hypothetical protein VHS96_03460 [Bacteroidia bacterium]|nr:hypothetical protein [Bacteroidia bacterium]
MKPENHRLLRIVGHILLAIFVANAANKFFVVDLDHEMLHGFYARIFEFHGDAPDQYRILPLLPLKLLCGYLPFNHAVLLYNCIFGFLVLELLWQMTLGLASDWRWGMAFGYCILYIFLQYTGWRPDTMGLMALCLAATWLLRDLRDASLRWLLYAALVVALSFSRAEIALIYALFATFYRNRSYAVLIPIPIITQILLQEVFFPDAEYYSKAFMLWDNLRLHYLLRNPATYLIAAALIVFRQQLFAFVKRTFKINAYFYLLLVGYAFLVLMIGRLNEYRLYLPFVPLLLMITHGAKLAQRKQ